MIQDIPKVNQSIITKVFPPRKPAAHKNDFGHLLVIGGSKLYTGSPILNALAAYKTGTDLVTIVAPKRTADTAAAFSPDLITYPVKETSLLRLIWTKYLSSYKAKPPSSSVVV